MLTRENRVDYFQKGGPPTIAQTNQWLDFGDALRTLAWSRATVRLTDWSQIYLKYESRLEIARLSESSNNPSLRLTEGELYFTSRGGHETLTVQTPHVRGKPQGTEFLVRVTAAATEFTMFDGQVELTNNFGHTLVPAGWQGIAEPGQPPRLVAAIEARNLVQWWIYYPGVIDLDELGFTDGEKTQLASSLAAYRSGHLLKALQAFPGFPAAATPATDAQRIYLAALQLAVGGVDKAEALLGQSSAELPGSRALRIMIHAVQLGAEEPGPPPSPAPSPSELLALSYSYQATNNLRQALAAARAAVKGSPDFGFGCARVAELEFSFGRTREARTALDQALSLSPSNAQAHCVLGFILAAGYKLHEAIAEFETAIDIDSGLGNAWLGRGLCRRRLGLLDRRTAAGWLSDLQTAAIIEPRRSLIRAYSGKAFSEANDPRLARKELNYAAKLDANDPTPPLYSALELARENRINPAIDELQRSMSLNDNRAVYRSRLLLDQDQGVRGASLARIYRDAGLEDVALREAANAVSRDYANSSAHQFLAESFDALRDPARFNLRYETVWYNELLLANLLSPVGAGLISQNISQQEYSRLFEANRPGFFTSTEYRSDGQRREIASQYGTFGRLSYALDLDYQNNSGVRPNNDLERLEWYSQFKYQLSDRDSLYLRTEYVDYSSGDNFQHYDPAEASRKLRLTESQPPLVLAAVHREWTPGIHTTLMGARLASHLKVEDFGSSYNQFLNSPGHDLRPQGFDTFQYDSRPVIWQAEANQIVQSDPHTVVAGGRFQTGSFKTVDTLALPYGSNGQISTNLGQVLNTPLRSAASEPFERFSLYGYHYWQIAEPLRLIAGLTYDHLRYPQNLRSAPVTPGTLQRDQLSPKAAFIWQLGTGLTLRGLGARALGGVSFDESVRLEPSQVAGFSQAFRSVVSEAEVGSLSAPRYDIGGLALDAKLRSRTYLGITAAYLNSNSREDLGAFARTGLQPPDSSFTTSIRERLQYRERSVGVSLDQLIGDIFAVAAAYDWIDSRLRYAYPDLPANSNGNPGRTESAELHRFRLRGVCNLPAGPFARAEAAWFLQDNEGYPNAIRTGARPGEAVCQVNLAVGFRFLRRRGEATVGVLNVTGQDYRLNSLTPFSEMPRERVWFARLAFDL